MVGDARGARVPMRRDARANRERILDTAEIYFGESGLEAPLQALAKAAQVGAGTLYRNFASHDEIVSALYDRYVDAFDQIAERAAAEPTGWGGIEVVLRECVAVLLRTPVAGDVFRRQAILDSDYRPTARWVALLNTVVGQAIEEGSARADLTGADVGAAPLMVGSLRNVAPKHRPWVSQRMIALVLDGMRAHPHVADPLPPIPASFDPLKSSLVRREP